MIFCHAALEENFVKLTTNFISIKYVLFISFLSNVSFSMQIFLIKVFLSWLPTNTGHTACVEKMKVCQHKADTLILSGDTKGMLKIWKYATGECLLSANEHKTSMRSLDVSADGENKYLYYSITFLSFNTFNLKTEKHSVSVCSNFYL